MTQLFMGIKPSAGPVIKIMKNNTDDPLTTPNTDYEKFLFNSELQHLSHTFGSFSVTRTSADFPSTGMYYIGGDKFTAPYNISISNRTSWFTGAFYGRLSKIDPAIPFLPMPEVRYRANNGRYALGIRSLWLAVDTVSNEYGAVNSTQFVGGLVKLQASTAPYSIQFAHSTVPPPGSDMQVGEWVMMASSNYTRLSSGPYFVGGFGNGPLNPESKILINYWNLPADASPMPVYTPQPNLDTMELSSSRVILTRPGYSIQNSSGVSQRILDSTIAPALVVAAGATPLINPGNTYLVETPSFITLSETAMLDAMVRMIDSPQLIPPHVPSGYVRKTSFDVTYTIESGGVRIYNNSSDAVEVTYVVFNTSEDAPSTGGQNILFRGNDGTQDFIQIKKPGTSDPASRPSDILLDTRLPTIHIIGEGYLPVSSFTTATGAESLRFGNSYRRVNFDARGMIPFVKFMTVFPNCILPPGMALRYYYPPATWGPPSNQSALCKLESDNATFYLSPGSWSRMTIDGQYNDLPDPLGIRYYIFGIPTV